MSETQPGSLDFSTLTAMATDDPMQLIATAIFLCAIIHTFASARVARLAHDIQHRYDEQMRARGLLARPSVAAGILHFFGEVEVVFGLWAVVLFVAFTLGDGFDAARHYFNDHVNYTEPMFVVVIMAMAATRPVIQLAEKTLSLVARLGKGTPGAWWITILIIGPLLGSFITEPAAMTICALLLSRQFYDLKPGEPLKYATLGLLFVNVSIGGTLTNFAAPPVLMVADAWKWDTLFMLDHFGWRSAAAIAVSTLSYYLIFHRQFRTLATRPAVPDVEEAESQLDPSEPTLAVPLPVPLWVTLIHLMFIAWTVLNSHEPVLFLGGFLFFLGFTRATADYQSRIDLKSPLMVGFFLAGLVIHGGQQGWWISPLLGSLSATPLFAGATLLTAFNDNALITYLSTLVPNLSDAMKAAVVEGAVTGGGLTVIANAPNPAGQALLARFFGGAIAPLRLLCGALLPTLIAIIMFRVI